MTRTVEAMIDEKEREAAPSEDWNWLEEDEAWAYLQPAR